MSDNSSFDEATSPLARSPLDSEFQLKHFTYKHSANLASLNEEISKGNGSPNISPLIFGNQKYEDGENDEDDGDEFNRRKKNRAAKPNGAGSKGKFKETSVPEEINL